MKTISFLLASFGMWLTRRFRSIRPGEAPSGRFETIGGWADGFLAEGYDGIGFDIERHDYGTGGYPGQLVLQDVLTLDGRQFRNAAVIVASPPCQAYSYRKMPWGALWREHSRMDDDGAPAGNYQGKDPIFNDLFHACFRIAREAEPAKQIDTKRTLGAVSALHGSTVQNLRSTR